MAQAIEREVRRDAGLNVDAMTGETPDQAQGEADEDSATEADLATVNEVAEKA